MLPHIADRIISPSEITEPSVRNAIDDNVDRLLMHGQDRFGFARLAMSIADLRDLPPLHLMDHRLRLPRLTLMQDSAKGSDALEEQIVNRLNRMLLASSHPGGRELVRQALGCEPVSDSHRIHQALPISPRFVSHVLRGRLGSAIALVPQVKWGAFGEERAFKIVQMMLTYHGAFQTQLLAARGHIIDRLLFRLFPSPRAYTEAEACKQLIYVLETIEKIIEKTTGEASQPPQRELVTDREGHVQKLRDHMRLSNDELLDQMVAFFTNNRHSLNELRRRLKDIQKKATVNSLHKSFFGLTSVETLQFASARLIQMRNLAEEIVRSVYALNRFIPVDPAGLPIIEDQEVAQISFIYRALILRDERATQLVDDHAQEIDLAAAWRELSNDKTPGANTMKKRSQYLKSNACERDPLRRIAAYRLIAGQRIDVLPDFLLQRFAGAGGVLPGASPLVRAKRKREQDQSHRPANIWRVSERSARA